MVKNEYQLLYGGAAKSFHLMNEKREWKSLKR